MPKWSCVVVEPVSLTHEPEAGRREEGPAAIEEAVQLYRRLAATNPDAYEPDLASSLRNWAIGLAEAGHREEGLAAVEEAVQLCRRLAVTNPDAYELDLAMSLYTLSLRLDEVGRRDEAIAASEEADKLMQS
ncbi:hypothetical protein GCM10022204_10830 [Microlunatus aurantiacus]|uniref:Tetratricopeptide repeat-containing protein n=1 Tax=Microlunatus aurantiacus TaxID=446786 RepID=A0ABP7CY56_9ACTN